MGPLHVKTGPGFHSTRAAVAKTSSRKHESVGHPLWRNPLQEPWRASEASTQ